MAPGGMQIVQDEHQRLPGRGVAEERGGRVEQAEPAVLGSHRQRRAGIRQDLGDFRHDLCDEGGAAPRCERSSSLSRPRIQARRTAPRASAQAPRRPPGTAHTTSHRFAGGSCLLPGEVRPAVAGVADAFIRGSDEGRHHE
jgi:hypothetical protein